MKLEDQQYAVMAQLPGALGVLSDDIILGDELGQIVAARLKSGAKVFGHKMFTWEAGDLWTEFVEELADALVYLCVYRHVEQQGSLPVVDAPRSFKVGDQIRYALDTELCLSGEARITERYYEGGLYDWYAVTPRGQRLALREAEMKHA